MFSKKFEAKTVVLKMSQVMAVLSRSCLGKYSLLSREVVMVTMIEFGNNVAYPVLISVL